MQDGRPIEFVSKTLSLSQRRWAQIEKELLAVVLGLERFDQYTYGRHVVVQNDHKPLENIMKKPVSQTPRRQKNLLMRLHRYDCKFRYLQGPSLLITDTVSRAVGTDNPHQIPDLQINSFGTIPDPILTTIRNATNDDQTLQILQQYIIDGWPPHKPSIPYWNVLNDLSIEDNIIYKVEQALIPQALREIIKQRLHAAHLGYNSMMRRVHTTVWWPGIQMK
ncbi:retrovirus-related Pol polyprotein from transposon 297 [Elysia marginata]|uniref:Retrovirus-related Pol polyprotein from transposon 297 n=1 Tax=Elysia marginata TaxID=1093978 RepID=A0AAV4JIG0_9GAST|nr:retrovirus-related Pol polyprotein from transposon 297 [Elysia marginata]